MNPADYLREVYSVAWGDLVYIKENFIEVLLTGLIGPLLYLLAFGYGVGGSMQGGGEEYVRFILPGIIALTTVACTFSSVSMRVLVQRLFYMSFDELLLCPVRVSSVILGKTLSGVVRSLISCTVLLIVGCIISPGIDPNPLIFLVIIAGGLMFSMFGLLAALITSKTQHLTLITSIFIVPMTFLCGTLFKVSDLPDVVSWAVYVLPLTHISELSRGILLDEGIPLDSILVVALYLCLFFILCYRRIATRRNRPGRHDQPHVVHPVSHGALPESPGGGRGLRVMVCRSAECERVVALLPLRQHRSRYGRQGPALIGLRRCRNEKPGA